MSSPMTSYASDAMDLASDHKKRVLSDSRLEQHQDVVKEFGEKYERAYQLLNPFYAESYKSLSFFLGNQWSLEELSYLNNQRRSAFTYNKVKRVVNMIQGYQRKNRLSSIVSPMESSSEATALILTDVLQYVMNTCDGYELISDSFKNALVTGICFLSPYIDYRDDPVSGDVKIHMDQWNAAIWDPFATDLRGLSDCDFFSRRKWMSRTEVISLFPEKEDLIMSLPSSPNIDDKFNYMSYSRSWGMQKLLNYTEYWRPRWEVKDVLVDMATGETRQWDGDRKRLQLFRQLYPNIEVIRKPVKMMDMAVIVSGQLIHYGSDPFGLNDYPFTGFISTYESSYDLWTWKLQPLVALLRDPQTELNKRRSKMVDILDNQLNTGWIAKTNSVSNPASLYKSGQGQVIFLKPEAQMTDIQRLTPAEIPASMFQLEQEFEKDILEIAGVNQELFGMADNEKIETAGILSKMRQSAGLVNLQDLFDGLRQSQKILSRKILKLVQLNYSPEKVQLITKKEPTAEFYSQSFSKYDIVVDEGVLTDTQKQSEFIQLTALRSMGVNITDEELIEASNLHNKKEIKDRIEGQAKQAKEMQDMQIKLELENQATLTEAAKSKALSDRSLAHEREAKIGLDQALNAERISRAEEDRTAGVLNLVKAMKELDAMDLNNLTQKLQILRELEGSQESKEAISEVKSELKSQTVSPSQEPTTPMQQIA